MKAKKVKNVMLAFIMIVFYLFANSNDLLSQDWIQDNKSQFTAQALQKIPYSVRSLVGAPQEYLQLRAQYMQISNLDSENPVIGLLVKTHGDRTELESYGAQVGGNLGDIYSLQLPLANLNDLANGNNVVSLEPSIKFDLTLDQSRVDTRANEVHQANYSTSPPVYNGYSGEGVLVVAIDTGIDWEHGDFIKDADGTSRIVCLWDQTITPWLSNNESGPLDFPYGVEYTRVEINDEIDGSPTNLVRSIDTYGHGTHVMGIIAGDGSATGDPDNYPAYTYTGMAPGADILVVKSDLYSSQIVDGIDYAFKKAEELNKPVVINLSLGSQFGAHDGSSLFEEAINQATGYGRSIVVSAGNEGSDGVHAPFLHAEGTVSTGDTITIPFIVPEYTPNYGGGNDIIAFNLWYQGLDDMRIEVVSPNGDTLYADKGRSRENRYLDDGAISIDNASDGPDINNGDNSCTILIWDYYSADTPVSGEWQINISGTDIQEGGHFDAWMFISQTGIEEASFRADVASNEELVGMPGTVQNVITVAAHSTRTNWPDDLGNPIPITGAVQNDLAFFSSPGPTRDDPGYVTGMAKPDISAPGFGIISALSSDAYYIGLDYQTVDGEHAVMWGTSMSAPHVAGTVALLFEKNPTLSSAEVKSVLLDNARSDAFTGAVPNDEWGYGKLDAYEAIQDVLSAENPDLNITPESFFISLTPNQVQNEDLSLNNTGTGDLAYRLSLDLTTFSPFAPPGSFQSSTASSDHKRSYQESKSVPEDLFGSSFFMPLARDDDNSDISSEVEFSEGFEAGVPPTGWTEIHGDSATRSWYRSSNYVFSGVYGARCSWGYNLDEWLISPSLDFSNLTSPALSFWWVSNYYWHVTRDNGDLFVKVSTDGGQTWDMLWTFGNIGYWTNWNWYQTTLDLSAYQGQPDVQIAFHILANDNADIAIDQVFVSREPWISFEPPGGRLASGVNTNSVVEFNSANLHRGMYQSNIKIQSNDFDSPTILLPVTMNVINTPPIITSIPDTIIEVGAAYGYQVMASDGDNDSLNYQLHTGPVWMSINPISGLITGTPSEVDTGLVTVSIEVTDDFAGSVTQSYNLHVIPTGTAVSGIISGILSEEQSPYIVQGNLTVALGQSLIIEPGVQMRFNGPYQLRVYGNLTARGNAEEPIIFTRHQPTANSRWGGIRFISAEDTSKLVYCNIEHGFSAGAADIGNGGAIHCESSHLLIRNSFISNNAAKLGAGIYASNSAIFINKTIILDNESTTSGSGLYLANTQAVVTNSLIVGNTSIGNGGGIYYSSNATFRSRFANCVLYGNEANLGDGIYISSGKMNFTNVILWDNNSDDIYINNANDAIQNITWSNIESGWSGIGNISQDPLFVNPNNHDYHLQNESPCINTGNPNTLYNDTDGTQNDMGNYGGGELLAYFTAYDFGTVDVNTSQTFRLGLINQRDTAFVVDSVYFKNGLHFSVRNISPLTIPALGKTILEVTCSPALSSAFTDSLVLISSHFYGGIQAFIKFSGEGTGQFPGLTIQSPNGGETWQAGGQQTIRWESTGPVGNVSLDYSINSGTDWVSITSSTNNDGEYVWFAPQKVSASCLIRIAESTDGDPWDSSDGAFALNDVTPPLKVSNMATAVEDTAIQVTWSQTEDNIGVENYLLYMGATNDFQPSVPLVTLTDTFYVHSDIQFDQTYYYCVTAVDSSGNESAFSDIVGAEVTDIEDDQLLAAPRTFSLKQNYPNPFNPSTTIQYQLPKATHIRLSVYNLMGQKIITLVDALQPAGIYHATWDGTDSKGRIMASGIYLYRIETDEWQKVKRMVLLK
jgi:subtilisin family serine protease